VGPAETEAQSMPNAIGIDLGGSHVMAALVDDAGAIVLRAELDIEDQTFEAVVATIGTVADQVLAQVKKSDVAAVGIGAPGNVELATGKIAYSPNLHWSDKPLGTAVGERLGLSVHVANDARCATLGEHRFGIGRGTSDFVLLTLGTGIGGGIVSSGVLAIGHGAGAGEVGHHQVRATDGFRCNCGKTGCFEAQASGTGLIRHALSLAPSFPRSTLVPSNVQKRGSKSIRKAAQAGEPHALAAWEGFVDDLSRGLANVIAFVNPEIIALGGGVSSAGDFLLTQLRPKVDILTTMAPRGTTRIEIAQLGNDAGAIGAAEMARRGGLLAAVRA
jgi:glucokinase